MSASLAMFRLRPLPHNVTRPSETSLILSVSGHQSEHFFKHAKVVETQSDQASLASTLSSMLVLYQTFHPPVMASEVAQKEKCFICF